MVVTVEGTVTLGVDDGLVIDGPAAAESMYTGGTRMADRGDKREAAAAVDLDESPFESPPIEGLPFDKDSEEARAIERVLAEAETRLAASQEEP